MRILVVQPGADFSTQDVYSGLISGLQSLGHTVVPYDLGVRMTAMAAGLNVVWQEAGSPKGREPTLERAVYDAGAGVYCEVLRHGIEAVVVITGDYWHPDHTVQLRNGGMPVACLYTESPYHDTPSLPNLSLYDHVWVNERVGMAHIQEMLRLMGSQCRATYLPLGYDPAAHTPAHEWLPEGGVRPHDVVFVGTGFMERVETLAAVPWRGVDLGLYGNWRFLLPWWAVRKPGAINGGMATRVAMKVAARFRAASPLWPYIRGGVTSNRRTAELYRHAKIGLNLFRSSALYRPDSPRVAKAESMGPRLYELAATGTFILSEHRAEVTEVFGDSVPTFRSPGELAELVWFYLARPGLRQEMASTLPARMRGHSWADRARVVVQDLRQVKAARATSAA